MLYMKKLDNFANCLDILKQADFELADSNDIYRMGVVGQFNLTFELAWKALQEVLRMHGVEGAETAYVSLDSFSQENFASSSKEDSEIQKETDEKGVDK